MIDPCLHGRIRLAKILLTHLPPASESSRDLPCREWTSLTKALERLSVVQSRGWAAARRLAAAEVRLLTDIVATRIRALGQAAETGIEQPARASLPEIVGDLAALGMEFPALRWDLKAHTLSVVTDDIELDRVCLGPFEVRLNLRRLGHSRPYDVIAVEPNPATGHASTPHPHVQNENLCEGEGKAAIQTALQQGRLLDFFILVRQVLETYNADSAYVPLTRWAGARCADCATTVSDDDLSYCEACDTDVCCDCSTSCGDSRCGRSLCGGCADRCGDCEESYCSRCLTACKTCEDGYCASCLTNGHCSNCQEIIDDDDQTHRPEPRPTIAACPALYAVGVGQAPVPPGQR